MSSIKNESTSAAASRPRRQIHTRTLPPPPPAPSTSTMPEPTPSNETSNLTSISSSCQFFWKALDPTDFPDLNLLYIVHNGTNYSPVRVIERDILTMYLSLSPEAKNNQLPTEPCTQEICDLLNDLNFNHYDAKWGPEKFDPEKEKLVKLDDFQKFYTILKTTCQRKDAIILPSPQVNQRVIRPQHPQHQQQQQPQNIYYPPPRYALVQHPFSNLPVRPPMYAMDQYIMPGQIRPQFHHHHHHIMNPNSQMTGIAPCPTHINNVDPNIASQISMISQPTQTQNPVQVEAQLRSRVVSNPPALNQVEPPTVAANKTPSSSQQAKQSSGITSVVKTIANILGLSPSRSHSSHTASSPTISSFLAQEKQTEVEQTAQPAVSSQIVTAVQSVRNETDLQSSVEQGAPASPCISLISIRTTSSDSQSSGKDTVINTEVSTAQSTSATAPNSSEPINYRDSVVATLSASTTLNKPEDVQKTPEKNPFAELTSSETQTSKSALSKPSLHKQVISILHQQTPPSKMVSKEAQVGGRLIRLSKSPLKQDLMNMEVDESSTVLSELSKETRSIGTSSCSIQQIDLSTQINSMVLDSNKEAGLSSEDLQQNADTTMANQAGDSLSDWNMKVSFRFPKYVTLPSSLDRPNRLEEKELRCLYRSFAKMLFTETVVSNDSEMWRRQFLTAPKRQPGKTTLARSQSLDMKIKRDKRPLGPLNLPSKQPKKTIINSKANKDFMSIFKRVSGVKTEKSRLNSSAATASEATTSKKEKTKLNSSSTASDFTTIRKEKGRVSSLASESSSSIKSKKGGRVSMSAAAAAASSSITHDHPIDYIKCHQFFAPVICKKLVLCSLDEYIDKFNHRVASDTFDDENSKDAGETDTDSSMDLLNTSASRRRTRRVIDDDDDDDDDEDDDANDQTYVAPSGTDTPGQSQSKRKLGRPSKRKSEVLVKTRSAERTPR